MKIELDEQEFHDNLTDALVGTAFELQEELKSKLTQERGKDTGALKSSIRTYVENNTIVIEMAEHGKYIEFGTPPHFPPPEELEGWVQRKLGVSKEDAPQVAFQVARAISIRGTRPFSFIRNTINHDLTPILKSNLKRAFK